jgi:ISXO2-like transposase domain
VEADETFVGSKPGFKRRKGVTHKMKVLSLVECGDSVRSVRIPSLSRSGIEQIIRQNVYLDSRLMPDTVAYYRKSMLGFAGHETVNHMQDEYLRGEVYTNTLEGYFSLFKRGMRATISIALRSICTAIWRNLISGIMVGLRWASTMKQEPTAHLLVSSESA